MKENIGDRLNKIIRSKEEFPSLLPRTNRNQSNEKMTNQREIISSNGQEVIHEIIAIGNRVLQLIVDMDGSSVSISDTNKETGITVSRIIDANFSGITAETVQHYQIRITTIVSAYIYDNDQNFMGSTTMEESLSYSRINGELVFMKSTPEIIVINFLEEENKQTTPASLEMVKIREKSALLRLPSVIKDPQDIIRFIKDGIENFFAESLGAHVSQIDKGS